MNKFVTFLLLFSLPSLVSAGFILTEENDVVWEKDNNYSQGIEFKMVSSAFEDNDPIFLSMGLRSRMYTPHDIAIVENQPGDRPWAGVTTVFRETTRKTEDGYLLEGWELGILGPESSAEWMQTTFHKIVGAHTPMGWSNQVPNEISAQYYKTWYRPLTLLGSREYWGLDVEEPYGWCLGTTFDYVRAGLSLRAGWNIGKSHPGTSINPKAMKTSTFRTYLLLDGEVRYVLHNATLGHSFFRSHEDSMWDRDLIPIVGEIHAGAMIAWKSFSLTYLLGYRTDEFDSQPDPFKWGILSLAFGTEF
jgi:lipid A 3-O-deacylase